MKTTKKNISMENWLISKIWIINKEKYINIITIVNYYREINNDIKNKELNILEETIKKFW